MPKHIRARLECADPQRLADQLADLLPDLPRRGIYHGAPSAAMEATVEVARLA